MGIIDSNFFGDILMNIYATLSQYNGMHQDNVITSENKFQQRAAASFIRKLDKYRCDGPKKETKQAWFFSSSFGWYTYFIM